MWKWITSYRSPSAITSLDEPNGVGQRIDDVRIQAEGRGVIATSSAAVTESPLAYSVTRCSCRSSLRQVGDDALGAAVHVRRDALGKGRYLRDAQPVPAWSNHGDDTNRTLRASLEVGLNERALDRPDDGSW